MEPTKYYDVTRKVQEEINNGRLEFYKPYKAVYVCNDTHSFWVARVQENTNEEYQPQNGKYLLEREEIEKYDVVEHFINKNNLKLKVEDRRKRDAFINVLSDEEAIVSVLELDCDNGLENWDTYECNSFEECVELIDDGYGILTY